MIVEPKYFRRRGLLAWLLFPLSLGFLAGDFINRLFSVACRSRAKVICVGNLTVGGVGKTPIVIKIVGNLLKGKVRVGVMSRGYGGRLSGSRPVVVNPGTHTAAEVGDEPFLIASKFPDVPVVIGVNRARSARFLEQLVDVIVMDDGLQNYSIGKDVRIVVFDGRAGMGNGFVLPAGPLRQLARTCLKGVDACIIMSAENMALAARLKKYTPDIFQARAVSKFDFRKLKGGGVVAFAGIGRPRKFLATLEENGIGVVKFHAFPDHHEYSRRELEKLVKGAKSAPILTTMKDFVKIPGDMQERFTPIDIDVKVAGEKKLMEIVFGAI